MIKKLLFIGIVLAVVFPALVLSSCNEDEGNPNTRMALYDIVTFESTGAEGSVFTFQKSGDSPLIKLDAIGFELDTEKVSLGSRVLLGYYPKSGEAYVSGKIDVSGVGLINNDTTVVRPIERYDWQANPVYLYALWRTGKYLNLHARLEYSSEPRMFGLVVDSLTLDDEIPQLYVVHNLMGQPENFERETYASFDIENVWNRPGCQGITVYVEDLNLGQDEYTFMKSK